MAPEHLNDVFRIEQASFALPWSRESFLSEITDNIYATYVVAMMPGNQEVVGYAGMWVIFTEAHITTLAVDSSHRRKYIGSLLLSRLLREAFLRGARFMILEVRNSNSHAKKLYEKYCFQVQGIKKQYYHDEDAVVMSRPIMSFLRNDEQGRVADVSQDTDPGH